MKQSSIFDETYRKYLAEISSIDYLGKAEALGVKRQENGLIIPLYDQYYYLSSDGIHHTLGAAVTPAVQVILSKYVLTCPYELPEVQEDLKTYRDFKDTAPLVSYFTTNTNKTIEENFSGKLEALENRALSIGGQLQPTEGYDLSVLFYALPRIPVRLNYNDRDDLFGPSCSILYQADAEHFLDMECLAMTGTLLSGKLIT